MNLPNLLSLFRLFVTAFFILLIAYERFRPCPFPLRAAGRQRPAGRFFRSKDGREDEPRRVPRPAGGQGDALVIVYRALLSADTPHLARQCGAYPGPCHFPRLFCPAEKGPHHKPVPSFISKMTTVFQMLTVVYVLLCAGRTFDAFFIYTKSFFFYTTALLTAVSGFQYVFAGWAVFFRKEIV